MRVLRSAALAPACLVTAWLLVGWGAELLDRTPSRVEDVVAVGAATTGALVALWYGLTALALLLADLLVPSRYTRPAAVRLRDAAGRFGAPVLRRAAVVGMGTGLALAGLPATAGTPELPGPEGTPTPPWSVEDDAVPLDLRPGLVPLEQALAHDPPGGPGATDGDSSPATARSSAPGPELATDEPLVETVVEAERPQDAPGGAHASAAPSGARGPETADQLHAPASEGALATAPQAAGAAPVEDKAARSGPADVAGAATAGHHVVHPGDSLWEIAAAHLGGRATPAEIAAEWPRWYRTNRTVIGADPDLIHPGQYLLAPD